MPGHNHATAPQDIEDCSVTIQMYSAPFRLTNVATKITDRRILAQLTIYL